MLDVVDRLLDKITMYRLVLYTLIGLLLAAVGLSFAGVIHYSVGAIIASSLLLTVVCLFVNKVFADIFNAPTNVESAYITALILALIISPSNHWVSQNYAFFLAAGGLAMASKYILTINKKHIFNPAAIAVVLTALGPHQSANWWVGTTAMLPFVLIGGLLIIRKIKRMAMVFTFFAVALLATIIYSAIGGASISTNLHSTLFTSSLFFLGFIMLTEPLTSPSTLKKQIWYAMLAGIIFPPQFHLWRYYSTPEITLVVVNIFAYLISSKVKLFPKIVKKEQITPDVIDFIFEPGRKFKYKPGQYMEWTLPHKGADSRGDRRYFTLASSPTEPNIVLGIKFYDRGSSFKKSLLDMKKSTPIVADLLGGDFVLPKDTSHKLAFIAGGIGITPYRSMVKYLIDTKQERDIMLFYSARTLKDFAYREIFNQAQKHIGLKTLYYVTDQQISEKENVKSGMISNESIRHELPDYMERTFYISGTQAMVHSIKHNLIKLGVPINQIKTDFFPGYS